MEINQILPSISYGDAISNHSIEIRNILISWGYRSEIYAQHIHPRMSHVAKIYTDHKKHGSPENILMFHFSIGSEISRFVKTLPDKKILIYHNITPHSYFTGINDTLVYLLRNGRKELTKYNEITNLALGDSEYNRKELVELGFKNTGILPIIVDFEKYSKEPNQRVLNKFADEYTNLIFVGKLSPNKRQEDIIKIFYYYNKNINPYSRLFLIGSCEGTEKYYQKLKELVKLLKLDEVYMTGKVDFEELLAYYKLADVFVSMSEHEGFCVPLLESMHFGIPIIAYNSTAIPYTLGTAGILINEKRHDEIAELIHIILEREKIRSLIVKKQKERLKDFDKKNIGILLKKHIDGLAEKGLSE